MYNGNERNVSWHVYNCYEKECIFEKCKFKVRKKVTGKREDRGEDFSTRGKEMKRTKRDYGNVVLERKNFPRIIFKYVLRGGRVEIVAPYP